MNAEPRPSDFDGLGAALAREIHGDPELPPLDDSPQALFDVLDTLAKAGVLADAEPGSELGRLLVGLADAGNLPEGWPDPRQPRAGVRWPPEHSSDLEAATEGAP